MSIEVRFAIEDDYPRIQKFLNDHWAENHIYVRSKEQFDWTFQRPGYHRDGEYTFALGEDKGELIGILGGIPFLFHCHEKTNVGAWIVNYAVRPDHRRGAAALRLLSVFRNPNYPVVIASGLNESTATIYRVLKGRVMKEAPRHLLVLREGTERLAALVGKTNPDWKTERALKLAEAFRDRGQAILTEGFGASIPDEWDVLDWQVIAEKTVGAVRDSDYLKWRYVRHPLFQYRLLTHREGTRTGLLVWRLEVIREKTLEGTLEIDRIGRIVEFLPVSLENGRQLMGALRSELRKEGALGADVYCFHGPTCSILTSLGFGATASHADGLAIPSLFQPLVPSSPKLNAMFASATIPICEDTIDCPWYWTKSDSDQDRPN